MLMYYFFRLIVTLSDSVKQTMNLATGVQARNNILDWRLQQCNNICDKLVLALDSEGTVIGAPLAGLRMLWLWSMSS